MLKNFSEILNERNLYYSGGDVTKMPIIGKVITNPIGPYDESTYDVVEIIKDQNGNPVYVCNFWYKDYKRVPQLIHSMLVKKWIPNENLETFQM